MLEPARHESCKLFRLTINSESNSMIHPLLTPRLYCQTHNQAPLPRRRERRSRPLRDFLLRQVSRFYRRWGSGLGFVLGLAIAWWLWLPSVLR
jgi:hypothetical protein